MNSGRNAYELHLQTLLIFIIQGPVVIVSTEGGVNIEDTAATNPEAISYFPINIETGLKIEEARRIVEKLGFDECKQESIAEIVCNLYDVFMAKDALLMEINPFVEDICGQCKIAYCSSSTQLVINYSSFFFENSLRIFFRF